MDPPETPFAVFRGPDSIPQLSNLVTLAKAAFDIVKKAERTSHNEMHSLLDQQITWAKYAKTRPWKALQMRVLSFETRGREHSQFVRWSKTFRNLLPQKEQDFWQNRWHQILDLQHTEPSKFFRSIGFKKFRDIRAL